MEERFLELLERAKQNGTQATVVLLEIEQLLHGENEQLQELFEKAKQNGTQATVVLTQIEEILCEDDQLFAELLERAKQNGTQATTILTEIIETRGIEPQPIPVEGDVQIFDDAECTRYATGVKTEGDKVYARINKAIGFGEGWNTGQGPGFENESIVVGTPSEEYPDNSYYIWPYIDFNSEQSAEPYTAGQVIECSLGPIEVDVTNFTKVFTKPE